MSFLNKVTTGLAKHGQRIVIAAVEKAGKTTLAADAPRALLVPMEMGYKSISTSKTPDINSWSDLMLFMDEAAKACQTGKFPFQTISFDSATALERLIHADVLATDDKVKRGINKNPTMENTHGEYGKAYGIANERFQSFTNYCDQFVKRAGINIVITCHTFPSLVKDAAFGEYYSWDLLLHSPKNDKTYGKRELITQWADLIGFLHEPMFVSKAEGSTISRAVSAGQGRILAVERGPGWVAGNRYGITGPASLIPIPPPKPIGPGGGWNALAGAIYNASGKQIDIYNRD